MTKINASRRIQILLKPNSSGRVDTFGTSSGLSFKSAQQIGQAFRIDYMGNSEFEGGEVAKTIRQIGTHKRRLLAKQIDATIRVTEYEKQEAAHEVNNAIKRARGETEGYFADKLADAKTAFEFATKPQSTPIYIIAPRGAVFDHAETLVHALAGGHPNEQGFYFAESPHFRDSFIKENHVEKVGWLEMDNGFFFFKDWTMFNAVAQGLEVKHHIPQPEPQAMRPAAAASSPATLTA